MDTSIHRTSFETYFSKEDFRAIVDHSKSRADGPGWTDWRDRYWELLWDRLESPLARFLEDLKRAGALSEVGNAEGYSTRRIRTWNGMVGDAPEFQRSPERAWRDILDLFAHKLATPRIMMNSELFSKRRLDHDNPTEDEFLAEYAEIVRIVDRGDIEWSDLEAEECAVSGQRLNFEIKNWRPMAGILDPKTLRLMPPPRFEEPGVSHVEVEFPTGKVLVSDWFNIAEFTQAVDSDRQEFNINCLQGRIDRTKAYAERHGLISVYVGNTCPSTFSDHGSVVVGRWDEDACYAGEDRDPDDPPEAPPELSHGGTIITDLWWATLIDRQRLVEIVAESMPLAEATQKVDAYVAQKIRAGDIHELTLDPGTYHLYFHGDEDLFAGQFSERYDTSPLKLKGIQEPYLAISRNPLALRNTPDERDDECLGGPR